MSSNQSPKANELPNLIIEFNEIVKKAGAEAYITRASQRQQEALKELEAMTESLQLEKAVAIENANEDYANLLLGCERVANALSAELEMWMLLKDDKLDEAWDKLISAQSAISDAMRAHRGFYHLETHANRLEGIEKIVFPPQVFFSSGMIVQREECSICGKDYDDCDHLIGKPYTGAFCYCIVRECKLDHISIVEDPADKRCRGTHWVEDGIRKNRMTGLTEEAKDNEQTLTGLKQE